MDTAAFRSDLELIPSSLTALADRLTLDPSPWSQVLGRDERVLVIGMGSSRYASEPVARAARAAGIDVVVDLASEIGRVADGTTVVAVSATGGSAEVLDAVRRLPGGTRVVAVTNSDSSPLAERADVVVPLAAGVEVSGIACRTFRHTVLALLAMLRPVAPDDLPDPAAVARRAADAADDLLTTEDGWLPALRSVLDDADGAWFLASGERRAAAQQAALMVREVPRRLATACETGDWAHVDVYLAKTLDYRPVLLAGTPWDAAALEWLRLRGRPWVAVGGQLPDAALRIRHRAEGDPWAATLVEPLIGELLADAWQQEA